MTLIEKIINFMKAIKNAYRSEENQVSLQKMSEKEKLIEILNNTKIQCYTFGDLFYEDLIEEIADQLLENGIIVPPVKIGQTVYGISRGEIIPIGIDRIQYSNRGIYILGRNEQYYGYGTITLDPDNEVGIEWYTTQEEVLEASKGGITK